MITVDIEIATTNHGIIKAYEFHAEVESATEFTNLITSRSFFTLTGLGPSRDESYTFNLANVAYIKIKEK